MKKVLYLLLITCSIFSMELSLVNSATNRTNFENKVNRLCDKSHNFQEKLIKHTNNASKVHIKPSSVFVPHQLGSVKLYHGKKGFYVLQDDKKHEIKKYFTDPALRTITKEQIKAFQKVGYFSLNQMNDGEFSLKAKGRINGGGPIFGGWMYWLTKSVCYGGLAATAGAAVVGTGGAIVGAVAGAGVAGGAGTVGALAIAGSTAGTTVVGVGVASTTGAAIITTAGIGVATGGTAAAVGLGATSVATVVASTTAGAVVTKAAVVGTGVALASVGTIVLGIEALSIAVGTFFGMAPTP